MKTYSQEQGIAVVNWNAELNNPIGNIEDWNRLVDLAGNWVTCACGNQCSILPRSEQGYPKDKLLAGLGIKFSEQILYIWDKVYKFDWFTLGVETDPVRKEELIELFNEGVENAKETLELIEERSTVLLSEL